MFCQCLTSITHNILTYSYIFDIDLEAADNPHILLLTVQCTTVGAIETFVVKSSATILYFAFLVVLE